MLGSFPLVQAMLYSRVVIQDILGQERLRTKVACKSSFKFPGVDFVKFHFILMPLLLVRHKKASISKLSVAKTAKAF